MIIETSLENLTLSCKKFFAVLSFRAIKLGGKPLMQQGSPKRNPESKAVFESNQKLAILEFARISKSQVFPSLIAVVSSLCQPTDIFDWLG